jgi:hypothetical protein
MMLNLKWYYEEQLEHAPFSMVSLWWALRDWWRERPRIIRCDFCNQRMWWNGKPDAPVYCSETCAYYGPAEQGWHDDDEILF